MASSTLAAPPFLPTIPAPNPSKQVSVRTSVRRLPVAASAAPSGAAAAARERRRFLERYGLNPDDFEDDAEEDPRVCYMSLGFSSVICVADWCDLSGVFLFLFSLGREEEG